MKVFILAMLPIMYCDCKIDLNVIAQIESGNNPEAYNEKTKATGLFQITPICLEEYNEMNNEDIHPDDLYNPIVNTIIASWYLSKRIPEMLKHYDIPVTVETVLWAYNAGIRKVVNGIMPIETVNYIAKYKSIIDKKELEGVGNE